MGESAGHLVAFGEQLQIDLPGALDALSALGIAPERRPETLGVEEFVAVTITYDFAARKRSYELLAQEFGLQPRG